MLWFVNTPRSICQTQTYVIIRPAESHIAKTSQTSEYRPHGVPEWIPGSASAKLIICAYLPKALILHEEQLY